MAAQANGENPVLTVEFDREDGRWIAEIQELPGVLAYGSSKEMRFSRSKLWPIE
jgi:hypothetical protein